MFLVEFGDGRAKKKVLDMCLWSYEKQLILLQDFKDEQVLKGNLPKVVSVLGPNL